MADRSDKYGYGGIAGLALGILGVTSGVQELFIIGVLLFLGGMYWMVKWWFSAGDEAAEEAAAE